MKVSSESPSQSSTGKTFAADGGGLRRKGRGPREGSEAATKAATNDRRRAEGVQYVDGISGACNPTNPSPEAPFPGFTKDLVHKGDRQADRLE
ncbi:hypothetical protein HK102_002192 [Quaeritorhiza haematococci]|nr:hypothetical protein HK102_002192 [Quaeritorhiza haematococci]